MGPVAATDAAFLSAVRWVIDIAEGGSSRVSDQGGLTRFGISQRAHPDLDIENLTRAQAEDIYRRDYWDAMHCEQLPPMLALVVFDAAVNQGRVQAAKLLQRALRVREDGIVGAETIQAARMFRPWGELVAVFLELRLRTYEELGRDYPRHAGSLYGWRMRCFRLALEAGTWRSA